MEKTWLQLYPPEVSSVISLNKEQSLVDFLLERCQTYAQHIALKNFSKQLTYAELEEQSGRFAAYLQQKLGMVKGERFAIMLPNILQYPIVMFGILRAGLVVVNINPLYTAREVLHQIKDAGAKGIIVLENFAHVVAEVLTEITIPHVMVTGIGDCLDFFERHMIHLYLQYIKREIPPWKIPAAMQFTAVMQAAQEMQLVTVPVSGDDIAFLQYTGGTTGVSKGAILTHYNVLANVAQCHEWLVHRLVKGKEVTVFPLPLYHILSLGALFSFIDLGAANILITNPRDIPSFLRILLKNKFSVIIGLSTLFDALMRHQKFSRVDFSGCKIVASGGMALSETVALHWQKITGVVIAEGYGLTEASPVIAMNLLNEKEFSGSVGVPLPSTEVSIRDASGVEVPPETPGEIWARGPQVMRGYWQNPEETAAVLDQNGWLHTGDIGYLNQHGMLFIVERIKDMIIVSGFNVYPSEIEEVLASHPGIREVAVVGVPCAKTGELIKAVIVLHDEKLTKMEIIKFCQGRLTKYKIPKEIEFRKELPKTNVGKVLRRALRE